jgi:hypothetical protein
LQFAIDCQEKNGYAFRMTWNLVSRSFRLLRSDKKLLVFPMLSAIGAAALAIPFLLALFGMRPAGGLHWGSNTWLFVFLWYWGASFITIFFNCALAACVQLDFAGKDPTLGDGLGRAGSRVHTILLWSLVSATVGQIARAVETRAGWTGRLIIGFFGMGWGMSTYLVVPVLVMEEAGVMDSVRRSAALLRRARSPHPDYESGAGAGDPGPTGEFLGHRLERVADELSVAEGDGDREHGRHSRCDPGHLYDSTAHPR